MEIGNWTSSAETNDIVRDARRLGIESSLLELELFGFTVIEPERAAPAGLTDRMMRATQEWIDRESPSHVSLNNYDKSPVDGRHMFHLLLKDPVFADAMMNPVVMTLARHATGRLGRLSTTVAFIKSGTAKPTGLHCDATGVSAPMPAFGHLINISYILTNFTEETGTLAIVPGSNRWCRPPTPIEQPKCLGGVNDNICIPILAKPGSIVAFNGNTWHGAYPKKDPGLRLHISYAFSRSYVMPTENYDDIPDSLVERYGPEFAQLLGKYDWQSWRSEGPRFDRAAAGEMARAAAKAKASV